MVAGELIIEVPNKDLHSYKGLLTIASEDFSLGENQLLLKGTNLQNTDWIIGICTYTGDETKIMLNS